MADIGEINMKWDCPWCFSKGNDSAHLIYDKKRKVFYCVRCCFTGDVSKIREAYADHQKRYRLMGKDLHLLEGWNKN